MYIYICKYVSCVVYVDKFVCVLFHVCNLHNIQMWHLYLHLNMFLTMLFDPYELCSSVHLPSQPVVLHGKNLSYEHYMQTVQANFFIPAMLTGTIDICHFIPLSLTLTLVGGHKINKKQILRLHFLTHFPTDQDEIWSGVEANQVEHPDHTFEWDWMKQGGLLLLN